MGMHSVEPFYTDPESPKGQAAMQAAAQQQPAPTPELMAINLQQQLNAATAENNKNKLQVDAMDKQASHQLATRKQEADEQFKARELAIREREAAIKEQELGIKGTEINVKYDLEQAKIADGQRARVDARQAALEDTDRAMFDEAIKPANGNPHPLEMFSQAIAQQGAAVAQQGQVLQQLAAAIERMAQPKAGRMVKRGDGVWDFQQGGAA